MFLWGLQFLVVLFRVVGCHFLSGYTYTQPDVPFAERLNFPKHSVQVRLTALWEREMFLNFIWIPYYLLSS
jgi:hypothetical protein